MNEDCGLLFACKVYTIIHIVYVNKDEMIIIKKEIVSCYMNSKMKESIHVEGFWSKPEEISIL